MPEDYSDTYERHETDPAVSKEKKNYILHVGLFIITFITCTFAGAQWISVKEGPYELSFLLKGLPYSISLMFIISCHEFGHYFAARYHRVKATLPYYIPFPPIPMFINFGTMGAVIRTKSPIYSKKAMFDIGIAGPLAGFVASLVVLFYGFTHVPGVNYLLAIHPDYFSPSYGKNAIDLAFGNTLLFSLFKILFIHGSQFFPPMSEIYHYPYLCVGWFGLFVTAMNMLPVGQLDGGHIAYTMFGEKKHYNVALSSIIIITTIGLLGIVETEVSSFPHFDWSDGLALALSIFFIVKLFQEVKENKIAFVSIAVIIVSMIILALTEVRLHFQSNAGWIGWLVWATLLLFVIKLRHPVVPDDRELDSKRMALGYLSFFILVISFSPTPFLISAG
ncbi:MAG: site-2 protease family protein [Ignavibacteriaceae bacterium]|nr:site-2 protease family protein [Ignavibacteriaceae bacterium]